ncbi:MAG: adenosine deaminase [Blastococcus sp.]|nr:adenosine deaminase [Blastococcus sp.]
MLPLAELHLHIEGTLESDLLVTLARRNDVPLPTYDPAELTARYADFADLQAFLDVYYANLAVLRTEQDFFDLATAYLTRAAAAGVRRAEIFCDPQTHLRNGVPLEVVFGGLGSALAEARANGLSADLIVCFLRDLGGEAAEELLRAALPFREHFIGVGLDSAEVGYPPRLFEAAYGIAAAEGLHRVAHAGEEGGPEYVREALDVLGVERIDHGFRALEDPDLVVRLREERVPLTVCPLSNVALKGVPRIEEHPLRAMLELGLVATINSDDPAYFGGGVQENVAAVRTALGLTDDDLAVLARNSFGAAFIGDEERARGLAEVAAWRRSTAG